MDRQRNYARLVAGFLVSGAVGLGTPSLAGLPGGLPGQATGAQSLLIPVQERGDPGGSTGGGTGGGGPGVGEGRDSAATAASAPATGTATPAAPQAAVTPQVTAQIADAVGEGFDSCRTLNAGYQIDCMSQQLRRVAEQVAATGAYAPVNRALADASRKLAAIAQQDRDSGQPRVSVQHRNQSGIRTYAAVRTTSLAQSRAAAARVLEEVQTVLLRSAATADGRRSHFQRIAATMESGKVLLRSS